MRRWIIPAVIAVSISALGSKAFVQHDSESVQNKKMPVETEEIRLTPSSLFRGDFWRLEPHLDLVASGCVNVQYSEGRKLTPQLEIWNNGQPVTIPLGYVNELVPAKEVSYSVREKIDTEGKIQYQVTVSSGGFTSRQFVAIPKVKQNLGTIAVRLEEEIRIKNDDSVPIWIFTAGEGSNFTQRESMEERARRVEWAMVLKLKYSKTVSEPAESVDLEGEWGAVSMAWSGTPMPLSDKEKIHWKMVFSGKTFKQYPSDSGSDAKFDEGVFEVDLNASPKHLDLHYTDLKGWGPSKCIFQIKGDELKLACSLPYLPGTPENEIRWAKEMFAKRPRIFEEVEESTLVIVYKRTCGTP